MSEFRTMKSAELHGELDRLRRHHFELCSQAVTEKLENPRQLTNTRKEIARVLTCLRERGETGIEQKQTHLEAVVAQRSAE